MGRGIGTANWPAPPPPVKPPNCQLQASSLTRPALFPSNRVAINNPCKTWLPSFGRLTSSIAISTFLYLTFLLMILPQLTFLLDPR